eukprot:g4186.t1
MERQLENMERELEDLALKHNDMVTQVATGGAAGAAGAGAAAGGGQAAPAAGAAPTPAAGDSEWKLPSLEHSHSTSGGEPSWTLEKKPGTHIIALDLHRCLLWPIKHKASDSFGRVAHPSCNACGSRKNVKWGCDLCNVAFCSNCTRAYEFNPAPVD